MIDLYINKKRVDLSGKESFAFTYQQTDFDKPTAVKNSFSKTVTLSGTPTNNDIFGHSWNMNRIITEGDDLSGIYFNANKRVPFILNQNGNTIEKGYVKLDGIKKSGNSITYSLTLYGELGDFFYNLSYNDEGETRTLADLYYGFTDASGNTYSREAEAKKIICQWNKDFIKDGWNSLTTPSSGNPVYNSIVAVPTYSGLYDDFDNDKVLVNLSGMTSATTQFFPTISGYTDAKGYGLVTLPREVVENEIRDLRSYYQRPAIKVKTLLDAIADPENNGGYNVEFDSELLDENTPKGQYLNKGYIMFDRLDFEEDESANTLGRLTPITDLTINENTPSIDITLRDENGNTTLDFSAYANPKVVFNFLPTFYSQDAKIWDYVYTEGVIHKNGEWFDGEKAYVAGGFAYRIDEYSVSGSTETLIGSSPYYLISYMDNKIADENAFEKEYINTLQDRLADKLDTPKANINFVRMRMRSTVENGEWTGLNFSGTTNVSMSYNTSTGNNRRLKVHIEKVQVSTDADQNFYVFKNWMLKAMTVSKVRTYTDSTSINNLGLQNGDVPATAQKMNCTKKILLGREGSPFDYLLSITRMLGLRYDMDKLTKKIYIRLRKNYYQNEIIDINDRIARDKEMNISPTLTEYKFYKYGFETPDTYAKTLYKRKADIDYGSMKVDTGHEFNKEVSEIFEDTIFKNTIPYRLASFYFNNVRSNGVMVQPSVLSPTFEYTLFKLSGSTYESETVTTKGAGMSMDIKSANDSFPKLCCFDVENSNVGDIDNAFIFFDGFNNEERPYLITDNLEIMQTLNENMCYLATEVESGYTSSTATGVTHIAHIINTIPVFNKYISTNVKYFATLDFKKPEYTFIGDSDKYQDGITIYDLFWKYYIQDVYNKDIKSITCYCFLPQEPSYMMKRFFTFDNVVYYLNKVTDYNPESKEPVKCEFVKVESIKNYLN